MSGAITRVKWDDFTEAFPAFMTVVATPLTFRIATGLSLGLLSLPSSKLLQDDTKRSVPLIWILSVLFLCRYAFLGSE
jgi:adenine/guanine/hypoxanthine permease